MGARSQLRDELAHCKKLNVAVQAFLHDWSALSASRKRPLMLLAARQDAAVTPA